MIDDQTPLNQALNEAWSLSNACPKGLDFVESVQIQHTQQDIQPKTQLNSEDEFFAFAGIWADRETTLSSLRNEAWFQS